jgi:hypothetical protein
MNANWRAMMNYINQTRFLGIFAIALLMGACAPHGGFKDLPIQSTYIDESGNRVASPKLSAVYEFKNGLAMIQTVDNKYGYINRIRAIVIPPKFDDAFSFSKDYAKVQYNGKWGAINGKGKFVLAPKYEIIGGYGVNIATIPVKENDKWGYININDEYVIAPKFEIAKPFYANGLAEVKLNGKWGVINESGEFIVKPKFDEIKDFRKEDFAAAGENGKWGFVNRKYEYVISPRFEGASAFAPNGLAPFKQNGKWGYVNLKGEIVIEPKFDHTWGFGPHDDCASVEINATRSLINAKGEAIAGESRGQGLAPTCPLPKRK